MNNYNEKLERINNQIEQLDKELNEIQEGILKDEDKQYLGLLSIVEDKLNLQLFLDKNLFNEEDMDELENIVNQLQMLVVKVCNREVM